MFRRIRDLSASFLRKYPCAAALPAVVLTAGPFLLYPEERFSVLMIPVCIFLMLAGIFVSVRDLCLRLILPVLLTAVSVFLHQKEICTDPISDFFADGPGRAEAVVQIADPAAAPGVDFLPAKKNLQVRILCLKRADGTVLEIDKKSVLRLPDDFPGVGYGDMLEVSVLFLHPPSTLAPHAFDYRDYLAVKGIRYQLRAEEGKILFRGRGLLRGLLDLRDTILKKVCGPLSPDAQRLAPGILFGMTQGIQQETRRNFLASGVVHILSVSGTHVAMFASLILLLLAAVPMRYRIGAAIVLTLLYAMSTGMQEPACRAFLMFAVLAGLRAFLYRSITLNTLALAACILLIWNPFSLVSSGFQFSFLTVAGLLLAAPAVRYWFFQPAEKMLLTPNRWKSASRIRAALAVRYLIAVLAAGITAWLVSLPLSLFYQGVWPGGSIFANLAMIPLIWLTFFFFALSLFFWWIPPLFSACVWLLQMCLSGILAGADFFSGFGGLVPCAPVWCAVLFLLLVFLLISARSFRMAAAALSACLCMTLFLSFRKYTMQPGAVLLTDGSRYACCIYSPACGRASVLHLPDYLSAREMAAFLNSNGVSKCDFFYPVRGKDGTLAKEIFLEQCPAVSAASCLPVRAQRVQIVDQYPVRMQVWKGHTLFTARSPEGAVLSGSIRERENGGLRIELRDSLSGRDLLRREFLPSNRMQLYTFELTDEAPVSSTE